MAEKLPFFDTDFHYSVIYSWSNLTDLGIIVFAYVYPEALNTNLKMQFSPIKRWAKYLNRSLTREDKTDDK